MITNFIEKKFVSNKEGATSQEIRNSYGTMAGVVGIIINLILFIIKFLMGIITASIAISADAFNNLSDAASSIITIVGFKMASKPADKEHPFGHGRIEYISALIVAFMVMLVGFQFVKSSYERIVNPASITFELVPFVLLVVSIFFKIWLSKFNLKIGTKINSSALKASAADAMGDVFTSSTVALSFLLSKFIEFPIDGYIGMIVAFAIIYAGFSLIKETLNPLLGEAPDPALVSEISDKVLAYDHISGIHDLIVHNYGPGRMLASLHAEIPCDIDIITIHNVIDKAEREISRDLNLHLIIHMDPISVDTEEIIEAKVTVEALLRKYKTVRSLHDFRIVGEGEIKNLIFDIVVGPCEVKRSDCKDEVCACLTDDELISEVSEGIKKEHPFYNCVITVDHEYC